MRSCTLLRVLGGQERLVMKSKLHLQPSHEFLRAVKRASANSKQLHRGQEMTDIQKHPAFWFQGQ